MGLNIMGYQGRGKMIRFEIPVLDAFLLSDALKCATNRHKIKDYADVMRIMNYRKLFESEAHKHSEDPPDPPKSDTALTTKEAEQAFEKAAKSIENLVVSFANLDNRTGGNDY